MYLRYSLAGFVIGALIGFSGVGGGSLMTPLLIILFKVNPLIAVGTDLLYNAPTKLLGALVHARQRSVNWSLTGYLSAGGAVGAFCALWALIYVRQHIDVALVDRAIRQAVGAAIIFSALVIAMTPFLRVQKAENVGAEEQRWLLLAIGTVVGVILTITSIGAGAVTLPLLLILLPGLEPSVLVGSDVAFGAILVPIAAAGHWSLHDVDLPICGTLLLGSLPGVYIGSRLSRRLPQRILRPALAGILILAGSRLI